MLRSVDIPTSRDTDGEPYTSTDTVFDIAEGGIAYISATLSTDKSKEVAEALSADQSTDRFPGFKTLDSTHTNSEKAIYSILYRETISKKKRIAEASHADLRDATGILGVNTIKRAIRGLEAKLSIRILATGAGTVTGTRYEVFTPQEITAARKAAGILIHPKTKKIIGRPADISSDRPAGPPENRAESIVASGAGLDRLDRSKMDTHVLNNNINPPVIQSSSVPEQGSGDDEKLRKVKQLFEQLSGGGKWKDSRDNETYQQIKDVSIYHIVLGCCYSVSRSPEHKMSSLAYAVPSILKHAEDMGEFPDSELALIAYRTKVKTLNCLATGNWTIPEWEK
jgi:hypothetical protein